MNAINTTSLYLNLLKNVLTGLAFPEHERSIIPSFRRELHIRPLNVEMRIAGEDWPLLGLTMIGLKRLNNIEQALAMVDQQHIKGDFVECGVWRGGASIYATALTNLHGNPYNRTVWLFDSFEGFPETKFHQDFAGGIDDQWATLDYVKVTEEKVRKNFANLNLDNGISNVRFAKGYFDDSVPKFKNQIDKIAILRFDGDMYSSTMVILYHLYEKLAMGGFLIIDDWLIPACQEAVIQFRRDYNITEQIHHIDGSSIYWVKSRDFSIDSNLWNRKIQETSSYASLVVFGQWILYVGYFILLTVCFTNAVRKDKQRVLYPAEKDN